jgi:glycosyltransferase involved in cell wall biosynthesis
MKILMVSGDRKLFDESSLVCARHVRYGAIVEELNIIVFTRVLGRFEKKKIAENVWLYPTSSYSRWLYMLDALSIGKTLSRPDLVVGQDPFETGLSASWLSKYHGAKLQLHVHTDFLTSHFRAHSFLNRIRVYMARRLLKRADCIRVVSKYIKESIQERHLANGIPISVLPINATISAFGTMRSPELVKKYAQFNFIALVVSRLEKEKQIEVAIRAWKNVLIHNPKAGLIIVGEGREKWRLKSLVYRLGISKSVIFVGWQEDVSLYYALANTYILTSAYEGYGMTLVEAALARLPIVTTDVGLAREVFKDGESAIIVSGEPKTIVKGVVSAIVRLIGDNVLRDRLAIRAREAVQEHYWMSEEEYIKRVKESFEQCITV